MPLQDDSLVAFKYFQKYVRRRDVNFPTAPSPFEVEGDRKISSREKYDRFVDELYQTWILGDKYGIPGLQNCAIYNHCDVLRQSNVGMSFDTMRMCYESTEPGAKLLNIIVDEVIRAQESNRLRCPEWDIIDALSAYHGFAANLY